LLKVALLGSSWVMYLLLALSVFSIATMIERYVFFRRRSDDVDELGEKLIELLARSDRAGAAALLKASRAIEARVLESGLRYVDCGSDAVTDAIESRMIRERRDIERGSTLLGTLGNNAPFIGLFGTVIGVIIAFHQLGVSQSGASMSSVMGGIAEALVATGVGLFVAIPAVVAYNLIQKTITGVEDNVASIAKELTALLKAGRHRAGASSASEAGSEALSSDSGMRELAPTGTN
jgi:biopolymer transport protein ExbB/biopolymer transport protein TolQ